jgi:L-malate glycosyltransferase
MPDVNKIERSGSRQRNMQETTRKRILYCEGNIDGTIGGSYFSLLYAVAGLDKSKYDPIVVFRRDNTMIPAFREAGIDTRIIGNPAPFSAPLPSNRSWLGYRFVYSAIHFVLQAVNFFRFLPLAAARHALYLRRNKIDLVHLNNTILRNHDWMLGAQISRTKCITHERGINRQYPFIARYFAKRLDTIVCISNAVHKSLVSGGVAEEKLVTIYNGIDPSVLKIERSVEDIRAKHRVKPSSPLIGVVGNIRRWKGQETIIRALPEILQTHPSLICFFIGNIAPCDAGYKRRIDKEISRLGIEDNVIFVGYVHNVADYIAALDVVLHTSIEPEPFGRVLIEAMSLMKPLVAANGGAVPEIIEEGNTGLMFTPGDERLLALKVTRLLNSPEQAAKMAERAYAQIAERFHIEINSEKIDQLYDLVLRR